MKVRKRASRAGKNELFTAARDHVRRLVTRDKLSSVSKTLDKADNKQKAVWKLADQLLGRHNKADLPLLMNCADNDECSKEMNDQFVN